MTTNALARLQQRWFFLWLLQGKAAVFPMEAMQRGVGILQLLERIRRAVGTIGMQALGKFPVLLPQCNRIGIGR